MSMLVKINDGKFVKKLTSENYNFVFDKRTGFFARWGATKKDDPAFGLPEIADIEVTTICNGVKGKLCGFCYKANNPCGKNMSFATFKTIFDKLPKSITQIAFGADASATSNPDLFMMMEYCRANGVIPNITVADISPDIAKKLAEVCGAVSVSYYGKDSCYGSIKLLSDFGLKQCNIHCMISEETYSDAIELLNDTKSDNRLSGLNSIVFLSLKQKGRGVAFSPLSFSKFDSLVKLALSLEIGFGFDSCSCNKFLLSVEQHPDIARFKTLAEPCESLCFSMYCNVDGMLFPCSFIEGEKEWEQGIDLTLAQDFLKDVWFSEKLSLYRQKIIETRNTQQSCFYFNI